MWESVLKLEALSGIFRWRPCRMYVVCICNTIRGLESQHEVILHFMTTRVSGAKSFFSNMETRKKSSLVITHCVCIFASKTLTFPF